MCFNCPAIKAFMKESGVKGEEIDASTPSGIELAKKFNIKSVPTVIFLEKGEVKSEARSLEEVKKLI